MDLAEYAGGYVGATRNNANEGNKSQRNTTIVEMSPFKRHLPIRNKEKVYNEWAAVLQRQDELARQKQSEEMIKAKVRQ